MPVNRLRERRDWVRSAGVAGVHSVGALWGRDPAHALGATGERTRGEIDRYKLPALAQVSGLKIAPSVRILL